MKTVTGQDRQGRRRGRWLVLLRPHSQLEGEPVQPRRPDGHELVEARQPSAEADREQPSHVDQFRAHALAGEARRKLTAHLVMAGAHACGHDDDEGPVPHGGTGAAGHCPSRPWDWTARASSSNWSRVGNAFIPPSRQLIGRA